MPPQARALRVLVTAGPTWEPIDDVRYVGNRSSGRMGRAIAAAAAAAGHEVTLLLGPVPENEERADRSAPGSESQRGKSPEAADRTRSLDHLSTCRVERFQSTGELQNLLTNAWPDHDILVMAAAVADYRPVRIHRGKLGRTEGLTLELEPTPDLLATLAPGSRPQQTIVAFALEPAADLEDRARAKLARKGAAAIVANPLETMDAADVEGHFITPDSIESPGRMPKEAFAPWLIDRITALHATRS